MNNLILAIFVAIVFKVLFKKFGHISKIEYDKKNELIKKFFKRNEAINTSDCQLNDFKKCETLINNKKISKDMFDEKIFLDNLDHTMNFILTSVNNKDLISISTFCSEQMIDYFKKNIEYLDKNNRKCNVSIINYIDKKILNTIFSNDKNIITVEIISKQINYIENTNTGEIIRGYKNKVQTVNEIWTFEQVDFKNSLWILTSIKENKTSDTNNIINKNDIIGVNEC